MPLKIANIKPVNATVSCNALVLFIKNSQIAFPAGIIAQIRTAKMHVIIVTPVIKFSRKSAFFNDFSAVLIIFSVLSVVKSINLFNRSSYFLNTSLARCSMMES